MAVRLIRKPKLLAMASGIFEINVGAQSEQYQSNGMEKKNHKNDLVSEIVLLFGLFPHRNKLNENRTAIRES